VNSQLKDKVIFITGAAGILGIASVKLFLERGAKVIANDIIELDQSLALMQIRKQYDSQAFQFIQADMTDEQQIIQVYAAIKQTFGQLDGLFNNVYRQVQKPIAELSLQEWNTVITGTLTSSFLVCKYAVAAMIESGGGSILNTSSILSTSCYRKKDNSAYAAAKAGLNQFTQILAVEYAERGIRANVLLPGAFASEEQMMEKDAEVLKRVSERVPIGRYGTTVEIAQLAAFLLSDEASYITSSLYPIDGGYGL
jgi:NAD(P)-dependent dehydrogenase (short-subunit alcohol dehydrogenase family)